jgi:TPP-dependent pyruvate/acetoin dehydrogenase alpha subunit
MTREDLIAFEESIAAEFNAGRIPYPVHLESGNEDELIRIFADVRPQDWVFTSWRGHLKALLKGVPQESLRDAIRRGESMALRFPAYRVYGSAIVGGTIPIALGVALAIKRKGEDARAHCFLGDMTSYTGIFRECLRYTRNFALPIRFIVEDNGVSVCTNTEEACGGGVDLPHSKMVELYRYKSKWPHAGAGKRVQF